jgi:hypothetical protein
MSLSPRRAVFALAIFSAVPLLTACPKKDPPPIDAAPPPPPPEDVQTQLLPMEPEDAGMMDADADAKPVYKGPGVNTNVARLKQCCNALGAEAKRMGSSPEAGMFTAAAAQCNAIAAQVGPSGTAPEMGVIRNLLSGRTIPAACAGF